MAAKKARANDMDRKLKAIRTEIDAIDAQVLALIQRRAAAAHRVGQIKGGAPVYRPEREAQILRRVSAGAKGGLLAPERAAGVFREIISACRAVEQDLRVSFLGPKGTFSEQAALKHFGQAVQTKPYATIDEVFRAVESGECEFAVVPVENTTEGVVGRTLDLLLATPLTICSEVELRVRQNLLTKEKSLAAVKRVYSHAQSLAQCNGWLNKNLPGAERVQVGSNAEAARRASVEKKAAAIAGELAGRLYRLNVLGRGIEDEPNNTTRFLVLGHHAPGASGADRTSLVLSVDHRPGAIHALLTPIAQNGVSMSRIESRPARARASMWEYVFFIDLEGHVNDPKVAATLEQMRRRAPFLKVLGSYPVAVA